MPEVHHIGQGHGSFLATITLRRRADGVITATLEDMPDQEIDNEPTITARFIKIAAWAQEGALDLMRQAIRFCEETRAANDAEQP